VIIIKRQVPGLAGEEQVIALFGAGLIGSAVARAIMQEGTRSAIILPFSWKDADQRQTDLAFLSETILGIMRGSVRHVEVVWTAGRAGFAAGWAEVEEELAAFESVNRLCAQLCDAFPAARHRFHMMSSAGGLFEGQRFVGKQAVPAPRRPYGHLKLEQEQRANRLSTGIIPFIYRPSSVYGLGIFGGRSGLIPTLIQNAKQYSPSRIVGRLDTIRDYVLVNDIGKFVTQCINKTAERPESFLLASGRPTAMCEVLDIVGKVIGQPLYLKMDTTPSNASHFSYRKSALPNNWFPTDLETGIKQVARQLTFSFATGGMMR
jgi:nucleoside-diphosphate-sugar epimerase